MGVGRGDRAACTSDPRQEEAARPRCEDTVTFTPGIESFESFESFLEFLRVFEILEFESRHLGDVFGDWYEVHRTKLTKPTRACAAPTLVSTMASPASRFLPATHTPPLHTSHADRAPRAHHRQRAALAIRGTRQVS